MTYGAHRHESPSVTFTMRLIAIAMRPIIRTDGSMSVVRGPVGLELLADWFCDTIAMQMAVSLMWDAR